MDLKATRMEKADGVGTIWLNRPQRLNAWTGRMHTEYRWCLKQLDEDAEVGVIVVTGAGRGFCVGGDAEALAGHAERGAYDPGTAPELATPGYGVAGEFDAPFACQLGLAKPIIAAINGPAAGVGLALACFTDLRFAVPGAKLTTAHGKLNLPAEYGRSWILPRLAGLARANDLLLTSRVFTTDEAAQLGIINELVAADSLIAGTHEYARNLIETVSPNALRQTRWQIYRDLTASPAESVRRSEALINQMMAEPDYAEGVAAFRERREPRWGAANG
ncbi:MAG: enoyl-CoA hydratase-related protein [Gammaproteobacteria bacterium]|nr:enoyl-CoA hydratase-related protein [Gammaproteobacteria bacterium]